MKKLFLILISILLLGTINVKAEEEYNIVIDENNNFILTDSSNNQITATTIAKYEENTLTLGEGKYFNQIKIKSDATITSNDKGVYIKELTTKEDSTYIPANITINKLKVNEDDTYICKINIGGNLIINDSEILSRSNLETKGYLYINKSIITNTQLYSFDTDDEEIGIKITNSKINSNIICPSYISSHGNGLYIEASEIITLNLYSYGSVYIADTDITITSGRITFQGRYGPTRIIKNSNITAPGVTIENLYNDLTIENSTIIDSGTIANYEDLLTIKNSNIQNRRSILSVELSIDNSKIEMGYFNFSRSTNKEEKIKIKNSDILTTYTDSNNRMPDTEIDNSTLALNTFTIVSGNLALNNTKMNIKANNPNYSALSIIGSLDVNNSNIVIDNNEANKIAAIIKNDIILDNKIVPMDNNKIHLNPKILTKEEIKAEFPYYNQITDVETAKVFIYEDESYTNYVQLATKKTATFKVKNGTWLDGTSDDIKIDYLYGEPLEVENLPKEVQELLTSKMGSWSTDLNNLDTTKDLDIEFKYDLINPETKRNLLILFIITIISIVVFTKIKTKHVNT